MIGQLFQDMFNMGGANSHLWEAWESVIHQV